MPAEKILCPGGVNSQTGGATRLRYPDAEIVETVVIEEIKDIIENESDPFCVPIWNSHLGEIAKSSYIWDFVATSKIKISDLWAQGIEFWHIKRNEHPSVNTNVGSVSVVNSQCSIYLKINNLSLDELALSNHALDEYKSGYTKEGAVSKLHGALIAPCEEADLIGFDIVSKDTVNPNNFTSFVTFQHVDRAIDVTNNIFLTGLMIRPIKTTIGESEKEFFDNIFSGIDHINKVPRLIFVLNRTSKVGLLLESEHRLSLDEILDIQTLERGELSINSDAGSIQGKYTDQIKSLLSEKFNTLLQGDFLVHSGDNSCIFICPVLGIFTHGYDKTTVEPVIRFYISNFFQAIYDGTPCEAQQYALYEKYEADWIKSKSEFIKFTEVM